MTKDFYSAIEARRSYYVIGKELSVSDERIEEVVKHAVKHAPSAFNSQSARVAILLNKHHEKLWDITKQSLRKILSDDKFSATEEKINSFSSGYGTILFFEDGAIIKSLQQQFATYKDNFTIWSQQSSGMLQYVVWTSLEVEGLGVSLQHYNNLIEVEVKKEWNFPSSWQLIAQMPFGQPNQNPGEKEFLPIVERVLIIK